MAITRNDIIRALEAEKEISTKGVGLEVTSADREDGYLVLGVKPVKGKVKVAIDEGLEGLGVKWGEEFNQFGIVKFVDPDRDRIVIHAATPDFPETGSTVWLFPNDFLGPLTDMWRGDMASLAAKRLRQSREEIEPLLEIELLPAMFSELRERQAFAVQNFAYRCSLMIGPPGTGKSYTIGATGAYLLTRFPNTRIMVTGPTNVAVDTALLAIDDWLARIGRNDLRKSMKRIGGHFNPHMYTDRKHLLAPDVEEAVGEFLLLELSEPPKAKVGEYARWKDKMTAARKALGADIAETATSAKVVAATVSTAIKWHWALGAAPFPFIICDEASQIIGPAAMMITTLGEHTFFAGDPQQLSPIVRTREHHVRKPLELNAFDVFHHTKTVRLNEQSRMAAGICHAVGATFYDNDLMVCRKARNDPAWKKARSPVFVNGREVPRICFDRVSEPVQYSTRYGGFIRFQSAKVIECVADELAGSYVDVEDILVLTPFRAQHALIRQMLRRRYPEISVSTVHRAQGSERAVVVFDPVDASLPFLNGKDGDRLINVAISRAMAHVVIPYHENDLKNTSVAKIHRIARQLWQTAGQFSRPFSFQRPV